MKDRVNIIPMKYLEIIPKLHFSQFSNFSPFLPKTRTLSFPRTLPGYRQQWKEREPFKETDWVQAPVEIHFNDYSRLCGDTPCFTSGASGVSGSQKPYCLGGQGKKERGRERKGEGEIRGNGEGGDRESGRSTRPQRGHSTNQASLRLNNSPRVQRKITQTNEIETRKQSFALLLTLLLSEPQSLHFGFD